MPEQKEKIKLSPEEETLLITLYTKATACPQSILADEKAGEVLGRIDYDFSALRVPTGTRLTVCLRARRFDEYVQAFLGAHPAGTVLHLGCGLDTRFFRVDNRQVEWYDLDMPEVIALRRQFFAEAGRYHMIPSSVTDLSWIDAIPARPEPVLIIAEGLLMYLTEAQVKALVLRLKERFPGAGLACDVFSTLTARNVQRNPSLKKTGAVIRWGIDDATAIEGWADSIKLKEEWYFTQSPHLSQFAPGYRLMFKLAALFPAARKAHRLLYFTL